MEHPSETNSSPPPPPAREVDECIGSLLVHAADVQKLSQGSPTQPTFKTSINLQKRVTVGTLLVPSDQLDTTASKSTTLTRRITNALSGPAMTEEELELWSEFEEQW